MAYTSSGSFMANLHSLPNQMKDEDGRVYLRGWGVGGGVVLAAGRPRVEGGAGATAFGLNWFPGPWLWPSAAAGGARGPPVRPVRDHRLVCVRDENHAGPNRYLVTRQPVRIPGPVPPLVTVADGQLGGFRNRHRRQDLIALDGVAPHRCPFLGGQFALLGEDLIPAA